MELKLDLEFYKEKVVKYLNRKMVWTHGFLRYNLFKKQRKDESICISVQG